MNEAQLELFNTAPSAKRIGGRKCLEALVGQMIARGRTRAEVSKEGILFVTDAEVNRQPMAYYPFLFDPRIVELLLKRRLGQAVKFASTMSQIPA
jgi:hypothetical protein